MKLIKFEAHGFKSFADPIVLRFDGGVAGIVGPNGSGKSNINDAIRWVLGEQSSKELRGDSMQDVIFAGSKTVQPMQKATVSLTFDNRKGESSIQSEYIKITRSLERGKGINEYFINDQKALHKEIKALAMETGIGKSSLAIISQGTVSDIANSSEEERRRIFEEAAGVSKYKLRKHEATLKLDSSERSLDILDAKIKEMDRQLKPLREAAEKAKKYKEKVDELRSVEIGYLAHEIERNEKIYLDLSEELVGVEETKLSYNKEIQESEEKISNKRDEVVGLEDEINTLTSKKEALSTEIQIIDKTITENNLLREMKVNGQGNFNEEERIQAVIEEATIAEKKIKYLEDSYNSVVKEKKETFDLIDEYRRKFNDYERKINNTTNQIISIETRLKLLVEKKNKQTNLHQGTKNIVQNKHVFRGYIGLVSELFTVEQEFIPAIDVILKAAAQNIVVENSDVAVKAINYLKANDGGRATFIPLASIKGKTVRDDYLLVLRNNPGFIGLAKDLVTIDDKYRVLNEFLLGNIIVVSDIKVATQISNLVEKKYMVVTKEGDIIRVGGVMHGGTKDIASDLIGLDGQINQLKEIIPGHKQIVENLRKEKDNLIQLIESEQTKHNSLDTRESLMRVEIQKEVEKLKKYKSTIAFSDLNKTQKVVEGNVSAETKLIELENELKIINFDLETKSKIRNKINADIVSIEEVRKRTQKMLNTLLNSFLEKEKAKTKAENLFNIHKDRLGSFYSITLENAKNNFPLTMSVEAAKELVYDLRHEIEEIGNVNLNSITELEELEKRFDEYTSNYNEVKEAKNILIEAIKDLDNNIINRLTKIVDDVNVEMDAVFRSMLGGGKAYVEFIDPKNILESGISIFAQPPGKTVKNLKLFSGGEKALIAISLLFAILKARPLPLCILDEVEAALDESNVVRYAEYLQKLKEQTQFLVITHRTGTMARVDSLFGATMQRRGVTSFFSVKLEDAKKLTEVDQ
ncbi:AAA family ATPase [Mycoplasma sp. CSL7503-lung]|uniref:AAA family ATPase n=1 Tax=Mycoplasma sp. CSL7503-lung TaxID=536372 RepID=UPI0021D2601C|nr:AAA family ATPase [Mycoplasma sp. CSL7503-lung]MCU4706370.1 AAA family ATPase [Mycoplasma sp. CSL7503-lung]